MVIKYAIFTHIPYSYYQGKYLTDVLWYWDIKANMRFLRDFGKLSVVAPMSSPNVIRNPATFERQDFDMLELHQLPYFLTIKDFLRSLPRLVHEISKQVSNSDIVHSNSTFFPPVGVLALAFALFKNKKRLFVMDTDFVEDLKIEILREKKTGRKIFLIAARILNSVLLNLCIASSNFTLVIGGALQKRHGHWKRVAKIDVPWVRDCDILSTQKLKKRLEDVSNKDRLKVLYASSLTFKKGILTAIKSFEILRQRNIPVTLTIFGEGPLKNIVQEIIRNKRLNDYISYAAYVPYGSHFYRTLRQYDVIVIPNLGDEQPRILFDAWANGVAVIASDTEVFRDVVSNGLNARLFSVGNPTELAETIEEVSGNKKLLRELIQNGVETSKKYTQEKAYELRMKVIKLFWKY
jgi:glycosyltransferase involved in cell wall biosynthesis